QTSALPIYQRARKWGRWHHDLGFFPRLRDTRRAWVVNVRKRGVRKWTVEETATVLLSDVHLRVGERRDVERAVAWVLERHPQGEVVFVGDLFEFSTASVPEATAALRQL